ncbi:MAG: FHA domain-containing protein [Longimicrobiaceae bacterium]
MLPSADHPDAGALAVFRVRAGPEVGREIPVTRRLNRIGREESNEIVLPDDSVSALHARLEYADGGWRLTDLESTNGTVVEGVTIPAEVPTPLPFGCSVHFGAVRLHFRGAAPLEPPPRPAEVSKPASRRMSARLVFWAAFLLAAALILFLLLAPV